MTNEINASASTPSVAMRFECSLEDVNMKRENYLNGIKLRAQWERDHAADTEAAQNDLRSILKYLESNKIVGERGDASHLDAFTLGYAVAKGIDFTVEFLSQRTEGARFNVYGIPKVTSLMKALNGGSFTKSESASDDNTNAATILALAAKHTGGKKMWDHINATCSAFGMSGGRYGSGATQGGSSLRALAALGIVRKEGNAHVVCDDESFKVLLAAARKRAK